MTPPAGLVEIPPVLRTVLYYVIAEAIIVCGAVVAGAAEWHLALAVANGNAVLFFGTAAAKVSSKKSKPKPVPVDDGPSLEPLDDTQGYGSGVDEPV